MKHLFLIVFSLMVASSAHAMSDSAYRAYRGSNARQIQATHAFNMGQIYRMQSRHDRAVVRHFYSVERAKERRHEIEMQKLRNQRPVVGRRSHRK